MLVVEDMTCRRGEVTPTFWQHIDRFRKSHPPLLHEYTAIARRPFVLDRIPLTPFATSVAEAAHCVVVMTGSDPRDRYFLTLLCLLEGAYRGQVLVLFIGLGPAILQERDEIMGLSRPKALKTR